MHAYAIAWVEALGVNTMEDAENFVRQAAAIQSLQLDAEALQRVAVVFARNAQLASQVMTFEFDEAREAAPVFQAGQ